MKPKCVATGDIKKQPAMNGSWVLSDIINENIHVHIFREYMHENDSFLEIKNLFSQKGTVEDSFFNSLNFHNIQQIQIDKLIHLCKD